MNYIDLISITFYISIIIPFYYLPSHSIIYLIFYIIIIIYYLISISNLILFYLKNLFSHSISIIMLTASNYLSLYSLTIYSIILIYHSISISFVISIVIMHSFESYHSTQIDSSLTHAIIICITSLFCSSIMLPIIPGSYILLTLITQIDSISSISINFESSTHNGPSSISIYIVIAMSNFSDLIISSIIMNVKLIIHELCIDSIVTFFVIIMHVISSDYITAQIHLIFFMSI
jgi:hypothetical protein